MPALSYSPCQHCFAGVVNELVALITVAGGSSALTPTGTPGPGSNSSWHATAGDLTCVGGLTESQIL